MIKKEAEVLRQVYLSFNGPVIICVLKVEIIFSANGDRSQSFSLFIISHCTKLVN